VSLSPFDAKSLVGLGASRWEKGEREEAFKLYLKAAENNSSDLATVLYVINSAYPLNRMPDLEKVLRRYLKDNPDKKEIEYCLAGCYYHQKKYALALGILNRILQVAPDHPESVELKNRIEEIVSTEQSASPSSRGQTTAESGDYSSSPLNRKIEILQEAKTRKNYDFVIERAEEIISALDASESQRALARVLRGEGLACVGKQLEADADFREAELNKSFGYRALAGRGAVAASLNKWDEAKQFFERSIFLYGEYDVALACLGLCSMNCGKQEEAWKYFERALSKNPENLRALLGLLQTAYSLKRLPSAEKALREYLDMKPADLSILYSYAGCLYSLGKTSEAMEELRKILLFEPEHKLACELISKIEGEAGVPSTGG